MTGRAPIFMFGCWRGRGHHWWDSSGQFLRAPDGWPWRAEPAPRLDRLEQREGVPHFLTPPAWSVVSFWDRSIDSRQTSFTAFAMPGEHSQEVVLRRAHEAFPTIWPRIGRHLEA